MLSGVIEGFYGRAWTPAQRVEMLDWIAAAGMNLFVYAPKDDIKLRARWREPYDAAELAALADLAAAARARGVTLMVALSPCLDITHSDPAEIACLAARIDQFLSLGLGHVALLFDDVPAVLNPADAVVFASFAAAQVHVANACQAQLAAAGGRLYLCPTEYCAAFTGHDVAGSAYLAELGRGLDPAIEVFWTGRDIVSETVTPDEIAEVAAVLRRKPFFWDNFHANDYDIRRIHAGPLAGRDPAILPLLAGWMTNPNSEFEANFVPVATTGAFLVDPFYAPGPAMEVALAGWAPRFARDSNGRGPDLPPLPPEQLRLLCDLCHQPFRHGPQVEALLDMLDIALRDPRPDPADPAWQAARGGVQDLHDRTAELFERMTELRNRDLFYAFHPYLWEAREELRHLATYMDWLDEAPPPGAVFPHQDRVYNFYRRGFTANLNDLMQRDRAGGFRHGR